MTMSNREREDIKNLLRTLQVDIRLATGSLEEGKVIAAYRKMKDMLQAIEVVRQLKMLNPERKKRR